MQKREQERERAVLCLIGRAPLLAGPERGPPRPPATLSHPPIGRAGLPAPPQGWQAWAQSGSRGLAVGAREKEALGRGAAAAPLSGHAPPARPAGPNLGHIPHSLCPWRQGGGLGWQCTRLRPEHPPKPRVHARGRGGKKEKENPRALCSHSFAPRGSLALSTLPLPLAHRAQHTPPPPPPIPPRRNTMGVDDEHSPAVGDDFVYSSGLTSAGERE